MLMTHKDAHTVGKEKAGYKIKCILGSIKNVCVRMPACACTANVCACVHRGGGHFRTVQALGHSSFCARTVTCVLLLGLSQHQPFPSPLSPSTSSSERTQMTARMAFGTLIQEILGKSEKNEAALREQLGKVATLCSQGKGRLHNAADRKVPYLFKKQTPTENSNIHLPYTNARSETSPRSHGRAGLNTQAGVSERRVAQHSHP